MKIKKCINEIIIEIGLLEELIEIHKPLINKIKITVPDQIETEAIGGFLHSFYNGIENIFKRITSNIDKKMPTSTYWHQELLDFMIYDTSKRIKVISKGLRKKINNYLGFRHFFRHTYTFQLDWSKMRELCLDIETVFEEFKNEINKFIKTLNEE
ncbi:MAG: hypothetical protein KAT05_10630 [Spirochaetes bacterium]|nr:hypothetical protein [Spirochaetota bacterium]